jgi:hypothetical protein
MNKYDNAVLSDAPEVFSFSVVYEGGALDDHAIAVNDLAPSLLALQELIQSADSYLNSGKTSVRLRIKATQKGSFGIELQALQYTYEHSVDFLSGKHATALLALASILGIAKTLSPGLIDLIRKLGGEKPQKTKALDNGLTEITLADGSTLKTKSQVVVIYQQSAVRKAAYKFVQPLEREGIDVIKIKDSNKISTEIMKEDVPSFYTNLEEKDSTVDSTRTTVLSVKGLWFDTQHN